MFLALVAAAAAACPQATTSADVAANVAAAEAAYVAMDLDAFRAAWLRADAALPCLGEVLPPPDAAAWHRLSALDAFIGKNPTRTSAAFRAALALQPAYNLPSTLAPEGNPLAKAYADARAQPPGPPSPLPTPAGTTAYVDGTRAVARVADRPAVVQLVSASGAVLWTSVVPANAEAPDWSAFQPASAPAPLVVAAAPAPKRSPTVPLLVATAGTTVASGLLFGLAGATRQEFDDPATPLDEVSGLARRTNTLGWSAVGVGAAALGLGVATAVTVVW